MGTHDGHVASDGAAQVALVGSAAERVHGRVLEQQECVRTAGDAPRHESLLPRDGVGVVDHARHGDLEPHLRC
jgi:hypothetical protein